MQPIKGKYQPFAQVPLQVRRWPQNTITKAPRWLSVDLRDGNQALMEPMGLEKKLDFFKVLCEAGFKEIEIGYPSASDLEFDACRAIIERGLCPDDVTLQVITPARENLIRRTVDAVRGAKRAVINLYTPTSPIQRGVVLSTDQDGLIRLTTDACRLIRQLTDEDPSGTEYRFEYMPESFSGTEPDYAVRVIDEVMRALGATPQSPVIIGLAATVERCTPNTYADLVEYVITHMQDRAAAVISVHPHNDRGTAVAACELALLAGAERVEGTLFGNGERTGNLDLVNVALNLYTQGVDPLLDLSDLPRLQALYEMFTGMRVHERHPYAGELVFTAFSGTHQDAIRKSAEYMRLHPDDPRWISPYIPIDPADVGRQYDPIIRINSQSGKSGAAFVMHSAYGYTLPKGMHAEFGAMVKRVCDQKGSELSNEELYQVFHDNYLSQDGRFKLVGHSIFHESGEEGSAVQFKGSILTDGVLQRVEGSGNGPIDAFFNALRRVGVDRYTFVSYHEHALTAGSDANAVAYIELKTPSGERVFGVGVESNINMASIRGVLCAINRAEGLRS